MIMVKDGDVIRTMYQCIQCLNILEKNITLSFNDLELHNGLKPDNETYLCGESYWTGVENNYYGL